METAPSSPRAPPVQPIRILQRPPLSPGSAAARLAATTAGGKIPEFTPRVPPAVRKTVLPPPPPRDRVRVPIRQPVNIMHNCTVPCLMIPSYPIVRPLPSPPQPRPQPRPRVAISPPHRSTGSMTIGAYPSLHYLQPLPRPRVTPFGDKIPEDAVLAEVAPRLFFTDCDTFQPPPRRFPVATPAPVEEVFVTSFPTPRRSPPPGVAISV